MMKLNQCTPSDSPIECKNFGGDSNFYLGGVVLLMDRQTLANYI